MWNHYFSISNLFAYPINVLMWSQNYFDSIFISIFFHIGSWKEVWKYIPEKEYLGSDEQLLNVFSRANLHFTCRKYWSSYFIHVCQIFHLKMVTPEKRFKFLIWEKSRLEKLFRLTCSWDTNLAWQASSLEYFYLLGQGRKALFSGLSFTKYCLTRFLKGQPCSIFATHFPFPQLQPKTAAILFPSFCLLWVVQIRLSNWTVVRSQAKIL